MSAWPAAINSGLDSSDWKARTAAATPNRYHRPERIHHDHQAPPIDSVGDHSGWKAEWKPGQSCGNTNAMCTGSRVTALANHGYATPDIPSPRLEMTLAIHSRQWLSPSGVLIGEPWSAPFRPSVKPVRGTVNRAKLRSHGIGQVSPPR